MGNHISGGIPSTRPPIPVATPASAVSASLPAPVRRVNETPVATEALMGGYRSRFESGVAPPSNSQRPSNSRREAIQRLRGRGPIISNAHFGTRNPRNTAATGTNIHRPPPPSEAPKFEALVAFFPLAILTDDHTDIPVDEQFPDARLTYPEDHLESCLQRFQTFNLLAPVSVPQDLPAAQFFPRFSEAILSYLRANSWLLPQAPESGSDFERKPYRLLAPTRARRLIYLDKPKKALVANNFTAQTLSKSPFGTVPNTINNNPNCIILFAAPVGGNLRGWVDRFPGGSNLAIGPHRCAGHRFFEGWNDKNFGPHLTTEITCFEDCTGVEDTTDEVVPDSEDELPSANDLIRHTQLPQTRLGLSPLTETIPLDIDEIEAANLRAAVEASLQSANMIQRVGESSRSHMPPANGTIAPTAQAHNRRVENSERQIQVHASQTASSPLASRAPQGATLPLPVIPVEQPTSSRLSRSYIDNLEVIQDLFTKLEAAYPEPLGADDRLKFTQHGGSVQQAAQHFLLYLADFAATMCGIDAPPLDADNDWRAVIETNPKSLAGLILPGRQSWRLEPAIGMGVQSAILNAAMEILFSNQQNFREIGHTQSVVPLLPVAWESVQNGMSRQLHFVTAGFFTALYILWTHTGPPMLSGIFVQAILNGWSSIGDNDLLKHLCPEFRATYLALLQHPLDVGIPPFSSTHFLLESALEGQEIRTLAGPPHNGTSRSPQFHKYLCQATAGYHLLGTPRGDSFHNHPDIRAFSQGMNIPLTGGVHLIEILRESAATIIPAMWCREITSSDVLLEHLKICPPADEDLEIPPLSMQESVIAEAIKHYFTLPGHPDCPALRNLIPESEFIQYQGDFGLRTRLFVLAATGSSSAPAEKNWNITIELAVDRGKDTARDSVPRRVPRPLEWQLCTRTARLWYDEELVNACLEPIPQNHGTFSRQFDRWFHSQIFEIQGSSNFSLL